jgi:O-antigen ligase
MMTAHPLTGVGVTRFGREVTAYTTPEERHGPWRPLSDTADYDPHSTWLGWAAECGLPGLAAWLLLWGYVLRRLLTAPGDRFGFPRLAGMALLGVAVNGWHVEVSHLKFVWAFAGLALALEDEACEGKP